MQQMFFIVLVLRQQVWQQVFWKKLLGVILLRVQKFFGRFFFIVRQKGLSRQLWEKQWWMIVLWKCLVMLCLQSRVGVWFLCFRLIMFDLIGINWWMVLISVVRKLGWCRCWIVSVRCLCQWLSVFGVMVCMDGMVCFCCCCCRIVSCVGCIQCLF